VTFISVYAISRDTTGVVESCSVGLEALQLKAWSKPLPAASEKDLAIILEIGNCTNDQL